MSADLQAVCANCGEARYVHMTLNGEFASRCPGRRASVYRAPGEERQPAAVAPPSAPRKPKCEKCNDTGTVMFAGVPGVVNPKPMTCACQSAAPSVLTVYNGPAIGAPSETTAPTATTGNFPGIIDLEREAIAGGVIRRAVEHDSATMRFYLTCPVGEVAQRVVIALQDCQPVASSATPTPTEDEALLNRAFTFTAHSGLPLTLTGREWLRALTSEPR